MDCPARIKHIQQHGPRAISVVGSDNSILGALRTYSLRMLDPILTYEQAESVLAAAVQLANIWALNEKLDLDLVHTDLPDLLTESKHKFWLGNHAECGLELAQIQSHGEHKLWRDAACDVLGDTTQPGIHIVLLNVAQDIEIHRAITITRCMKSPGFASTSLTPANACP